MQDLRPKLTIHIHNSPVYMYNVPPYSEAYHRESGLEQQPQVQNQSQQQPPQQQQSGQPTIPTENTQSVIRMHTTLLTPSAMANQAQTQPQTQGGSENPDQQYASWVQSLNNTQIRIPDASGTGTGPGTGTGTGMGGLPTLQTMMANVLQGLIPGDDIQIEVMNGVIGGGGGNGQVRTSVNSLVEGSTLMTPTQEMIEDENQVCAICHGSYTDNDILRKINTCEHVFHARCVERWFTTHDSCPVCRGRLGGGGGGGAGNRQQVQQPPPPADSQ